MQHELPFFFLPEPIDPIIPPLGASAGCADLLKRVLFIRCRGYSLTIQR
jgi:hypothetical protein